MRPTQPSPIPPPSPGPFPPPIRPTREMPVAGQAIGTLTEQPGGQPAGEPTEAGRLTEAARSTGPVEGLPPLPTAESTASTADAAATPAHPRRGLRPGALVRLGLGAVAVAVLELGLTLHLGSPPLWSTVRLWAAFASLAAVVGLVGVAGLAPVRPRWSAGRAWWVGAGGLAGLAVFWLLVVLPHAGTDRGFLLTAPLACLGAALWTAPRTHP